MLNPRLINSTLPHQTHGIAVQAIGNKVMGYIVERNVASKLLRES
jgi:hypothetical protein